MGKKEHLENYRPVSLTSIPGKVTEQILLEAISKHIKDKKVIGSYEHGFMRRKSCLTNLIAFYNEMTGSMNEGRTADSVYLDFSKAFVTASHNILIDKLMKCRLDQWAIRVNIESNTIISSVMIWTVGQRLIHQSVHAAIQRDLNRLEKWADRHLILLSKGKCKILYLGRNNPMSMYQYMLEANWLERQLAQKDLGILLNKFNMSKQ
ncbi:mitochondrial enolase superfamily member 1 [Grus japonensis]|uniref:Mitochondrial enolase superfamily member 1 n=1 Tax=Grus japonensis TaxID=30415 RepID=A0ABC9Y2H5_GRUJA